MHLREVIIYNSDIDCFETLERDILNFTTENYKLCLLGDFNSHTKDEYDFITVDSDIQHTLDMGNLDSSFNYCSIEQLGFSKERHNSDQSRIDNYGRRLLELCKSCDLFIANGRLGLDRFLGGKTCKCTTVVDYVILSPSLFPFISEFEILPFDPMTSDAHNGLHFSLICNEIEFKQPDSYDQPVSVTRSTWNGVESASFVQSLDTIKIASFIEKIDALNPEQVSTKAIEEFTSECSSILTDAANDTGFIKQIQRKSKVKTSIKHKPIKRTWFNNECAVLRRQYKRAKNLRHRVNSVVNHQLLHNASKAYKKCINRQFRQFNQDFIHKLRALKNSDPKSYWNLLNKADQSRRETLQKVSLETFAQHFEKLNSAASNHDNNEDPPHDIDLSRISKHNFELNSEITEEEVLKCLTKLKLNKACSSDLILNEFLKFSKTKMLTAFTKLFNLIFSSGLIPDEWSQGIISPIYKNKGDKANPDNYRGITILSCFGKLFTAVLNNRLNNYLENMSLLCEEQAGFRKNYGTTDHIFNLKCLIDLYCLGAKNCSVHL